MGSEETSGPATTRRERGTRHESDGAAAESNLRAQDACLLMARTALTRLYLPFCRLCDAYAIPNRWSMSSPKSHWLENVAGHAGLELDLPSQPDIALIR